MGHIYLYTGSGGGKTTNALGLALRSIGHGHKVVVIQFLKHWKSTGEYKAMAKLKPYYEIHQFGRPGWFKMQDHEPVVYKFGGKAFTVKSLEELDKELAKEALAFACKKMGEKPHLLILDEINLALHWKLLNIEEVLELLKNIPKRTEIVLTGRHAPDKLRERADFVNLVVDKKHPENIPMTKGIQY